MGQVLRAHSWRVNYVDLNFTDAQGRPFGIGRAYFVEEPHFGQFVHRPIVPMKGPSLEKLADPLDKPP